MEKVLINLICSAAEDWNLSPSLCCALVETESNGICSVTRYEPAFRRKYVNANKIPVQFKTWSGQQLLATSFGLTQIMGLVAIELGLDGPLESLLIPEINLRYGLKKLKSCFADHPLDRDALLKYNGGGDPTYPDRVLAAREKYLILDDPRRVNRIGVSPVH